MKRFSQYVRRCVHAPAAAFTEHWQCLPGTLRVTTAAVLLVFGLVCLLLFTASCAHTLQGLSREQALYQAGTNAVAQVQSLTPYLPAPAGNAMEIVLAIVSSGLAAWNLHQQAALKKLKNGNGNGNGHGNGNGKTPSPTTDPPAAAPLAQPVGLRI